MTHMEAIAAVAQGVINVTEAKGEPLEARRDLALIEHGSRIFRGMSALVLEEQKTIGKLIAARKLAKDGQVVEAIEVLDRMIAERTDPEFEPDDLESVRGEGV